MFLFYLYYIIFISILLLLILLTIYYYFLFCLYRELQLYKVTFDEPLQADQDIRITIKVSYTHSLKPLPAKIPQVARQLLMYKGNVFFFSPYETDEIKTTVV